MTTHLKRVKNLPRRYSNNGIATGKKQREGRKPLLLLLPSKKKKEEKQEKEKERKRRKRRKKSQRVKQTINRRINSTVWPLKCARVGMECGTN